MIYFLHFEVYGIRHFANFGVFEEQQCTVLAYFGWLIDAFGLLIDVGQLLFGCGYSTREMFARRTAFGRIWSVYFLHFEGCGIRHFANFGVFEEQQRTVLAYFGLLIDAFGLLIDVGQLLFGCEDITRKIFARRTAFGQMTPKNKSDKL